MNRAHHSALICGGPGEWYVAEWAHRRDRDRVLSEPWPFGWTAPAPARTGDDHFGPAHPRSTMVARCARQLRKKIQRRRDYAVQASLYAQAATPDLIIVDEISAGPEYGTRLHRLMEEYVSGQAPAGSAAWRRRNGGV